MNLIKLQEKFREISQLMDCMGCERCKVWGKLQVKIFYTHTKVEYSFTRTFFGARTT
mgnify:CR=1 FL=1